MIRLHLSPDAAVSFKEKERRASLDLVKAFLAAAAVHFVLFFSIRICTLSTAEKCIPLSPVAVEIDLGSPILAPLQKKESFVVDWGRSEGPNIEIPSFHPTVSIGEYPPSDLDDSDIEWIDYQILDDFEEEAVDDLG